MFHKLSYPIPATTTGFVFAFDRDYTVDVNPPTQRGERGVPLEWVRHLAHNTGHAVFATGNQALKDEAEIPGTSEVVEHHDELDYDVIYTKEQEEAVHPFEREKRVAHVGDLYPEAEQQIVIDDIDVSHVDGWTHYYPWDFVEAVEAGEILEEIDFPEA